jgi:hypothetical protein
MTNEDRNALREAAIKATPGPWTCEPDMRQEYSPHSQSYNGEEYVAGYNISSDSREVISEEGILADGEANAAYIAAAHPAAVLALLEQNERMREALGSIAGMTREMEHDLFSATQVARAALGDGA